MQWSIWKRYILLVMLPRYTACHHVPIKDTALQPNQESRNIKRFVCLASNYEYENENSASSLVRCNFSRYYLRSNSYSEIVRWCCCFWGTLSWSAYAKGSFKFPLDVLSSEGFIAEVLSWTACSYVGWTWTLEFLGRNTQYWRLLRSDISNEITESLMSKGTTEGHLVQFFCSDRASQSKPLRTVSSWVSPRMETPSPLQSTCSSIWSPTQ